MNPLQLLRETSLGAVIRQFLLAFVPFSLLAALIVYGLDWQQRQAYLDSLRAAETADITSARRIVARDFSGIVSDLMILSNANSLHELLDAPSPSHYQTLTDEFLLFSRKKRVYDQIRYLDESGMEIARVNFNNGDPAVTPAQELQNKKDRYYFSESIGLSKGVVYVSPFDLNIEHGQLEIPRKPTIRFATPVFDRQGHRRGVVVINFLGQQLIDHFRESLAGSRGTPHFLNADGYWLFGPDAENDWAFVLNKRDSFAAAHPNAWASMRQEQGQIMRPDGLFTFATLYPLEEAQPGAEGTGIMTGISSTGQNARGYYWKLVSHIPAAKLDGILDQRFDFRAAWLYGGIEILIAILSISYALVRVGQLRNEEKLKLSAKVTEVTSDGVVILDDQKRIISINHAFSAITGYIPPDVMGKTPDFLRADGDNRELCHSIWESVQTKGHWEGELWNRRKSGEAFPVWTTLSAITDNQNRLVNFVEIFDDITERKLVEQNLQSLAYHDHLTGLPNRALLADRLNMAIASADRHQTKVGVMFIDLNKFKPINDLHGHAAGDQVLRETAQRIRAAIRANDTAARLGGDEFVVLLQDIRDRSEVEWLAEKILAAIEKEYLLGNTACQLTASIGISLFPDDGDVPEKLLQDADIAMYEAKQASRKNA